MDGWMGGCIMLEICVKISIQMNSNKLHHTFANITEAELVTIGTVADAANTSAG